MTTSADGESGVEGFLQVGRGGHHHRAGSPADTDQVHGERNAVQTCRNSVNVNIRAELGQFRRFV